MPIRFHVFVNILVAVVYTELRIKHCIRNRNMSNQKKLIQAFRKFTVHM
jgi:hypothetical protein